MKTIMEMAREAGLGDAEGWINEEYDYKKEILAFAELVATAEREACAIDGGLACRYFEDSERVKSAIRARGNT